MIELCGARVLPGTIDVGGEGPPLQTVMLRDARVKSLLGVEVPRERCAEILTALEFKPKLTPDGLDVVVPAFRRTDVTREADLIEEVARLGALQDLPATLPSRNGASGRLTDAQRLRRRAADALTAQGLHEIVGWSFEGPVQVARLRIADRPVVELENPMSTDQSRLRTTLLGSLLDVGQRNRSRGASALRLFEAGAVYLPDPADPAALPSEPYHVAALLSGPVRPATWRSPEPRDADFFAAKGVAGGMLDTLHVPWTVEADPEPAPFLHPGQAARILIAGAPAGWIGRIHPDVAGGWDFDAEVAAFEVNLDVAAAHVRFTSYQDLTSFPEVREDLAVIVADTVTAAQVLEVVRGAGGALLTGADVFDVYRDAQTIGAGHVSLAVRLRFRAADRTLTDEEVAARRRKIASALATQLEGRVRDS
jgi:phenylalanyl-tRNA synthetase beta chain